jgi:A/G-specific adenine glycosylase
MNSFFNKISIWYQQNKRDLPWRNTHDPYKIWLSEIILQQTRVEQGLPYYYKFIEDFPTLTDLANANEESILKLWQGLGYYSRARSLHATAKVIRDKYHGIFPNNYSDIIQLKGIGDYTAAAISSFAFNLPHAVVDGNVYRVLSRIYDIEVPIDSTAGKKLFNQLANELLFVENPALFNQAIMEFGALQCKPVNPVCLTCPFQENCLAFQNNTITFRPVKASKTKVTNRYFYYFVFLFENSLLIKKRHLNDIWKGLYDFPLIEKNESTELIDLLEDKKIGENAVYKIVSMKHILSHQRINASFVILNYLPPKTSWEEDWILADIENMADYPIPRMIDKFLKENHF